MRSPLPLLHPDGVSRASASLDGDSSLEDPLGTPADGPLDLVVLSRTAARDPGDSKDGRIAAAARRLDEDGLMIVTRPSHAITSELARLGLEAQESLLHVPEVENCRYLMPTRGNATRYALRRTLALKAHKRIAARALALPPVRAMAPTSVVFRRPRARPLLAWLGALGDPLQSCTAIIDVAWRPRSSTVLHRFGPDPEPDLIAKVGGGAAQEARALRDIAPTAARGFARVPGLLAESRVGEQAVAAQTPVSGRPASGLLERAPATAPTLLRRLAQGLVRWNRSTARPRPFSAADAEEMVLAPARRLAPTLDGGWAQLAMLERLCAACQGQMVPFVSAHNDLTAVNMLVDDEGRIGVVDWEHASRRALPLGDLIYAAADLAAAAHGYRDRPAAHIDCFGPGGRLTDLTAEVVEETRRSFGISAEVGELCAQACWLQHADNEQRTAKSGQSDAPFLAILQTVARRGTAIGGAAATREP